MNEKRLGIEALVRFEFKVFSPGLQDLTAGPSLSILGLEEQPSDYSVNNLMSTAVPEEIPRIRP